MYRIRTYQEAQDQVEALPDHALELYAQVLGVLELAPWNSHPHNEHNPDGALRQLTFGGQGFVVYLILDDQRYVDIISVIWVG